MISIRKATNKDLETVVNIRMEMLKVVNNLPENYIFSEDFINSTINYFKNSKQTTLLAFNDNSVIGCATICYIYVMPTFDHPTGKRAHIMNVYTNKNYRRMGIAYKMMNKLIDEAKQNGITEISLDATDSGKPLYEKCGFISSADGMVLTFSKVK